MRRQSCLLFACLCLLLAGCIFSTGGLGTGTTGTGGTGGSSSATGGGGSSSSSTTTGGGGTGGNSNCGNNAVEDPEICDGSDLAGKDCTTVPGGFTDGTLKCLKDCSGFDTSDCTLPPTCGDSVCNNGETCVSCPGDCGSCCGNGTIDNGESCDGANLNNSDCGNIQGGFTKGNLACKADCSFDTSGCQLPPAVCTAGSPGTVDNITASGATQTSVLIDYATGVDFFSTVSPTVKNFNGSSLPGQLVILGKDGLQFTLKNGATLVAKPFYKVDLTVALPVDCSGGANLVSQTCLATIAKSFRCQFAPYSEQFNCPSPAIVFTAQPAASSYADGAGSPGFRIILADLTCN